MSIFEYQDVVKAKAEKWKGQVGRLQEQISNGEEVVAASKESISRTVEFWEQVKLNKPSAQLTSLIQAKAAGSENPRFLEFCCKSARRALETGDYTSLADLAQ